MNVMTIDDVASEMAASLQAAGYAAATWGLSDERRVYVYRDGRGCGYVALDKLGRPGLDTVRDEHRDGIARAIVPAKPEPPPLLVRPAAKAAKGS